MQSHPLSLLQTDFLQGPHQASSTIWRPELGGRLELSELQVEGIWMVPAVLTAKWDKRLQFPCGNHCGCLFIHNFRHEFQISALFLKVIRNKENVFLRISKILLSLHNLRERSNRDFYCCGCTLARRSLETPRHTLRDFYTANTTP